MIDIRTKKDLKEFPVLDDPMIRIYIFLNEEGKIKIGKTKDIYKRYVALCGSNSQGIELISCIVSPGTYLHSLEIIMHDKFDKYRIPNTEWFYDKNDPSGDSLFAKASEELKLLFSSADYKKCNDLKKSMYKGGDV